MSNVIKQAESGKPFNWGSFAVDTAIGGALGFLGPAAGAVAKAVAPAASAVVRTMSSALSSGAGKAATAARAAVSAAASRAATVSATRAAAASASRTATQAASAVSKFGSLSQSSFGIASYTTQRAITAGKGGLIQAHHLIEKRFARQMGGNTDDWATIVVTRDEHQVFTNAWRQAIPYGRNGTRIASRGQVEDAARNIYVEYPEILQALGLE